jgi:hypothetical protein
VYHSRGGAPSPFSLSLLFAHMPALRDIHDALHRVIALKNPSACGASLLRRLESSRIELFFGGTWPAASSAGARPVECSALSNTAAAPTPPLSAALSFSCRRLAAAGNEAPGRWWLPFPHPRFLLRSACLADGSLPRAAKRLAGEGFRPTSEAAH